MQALIRAVPAIGHAAIVCGAFYLMFAIVATNLLAVSPALHLLLLAGMARAPSPHTPYGPLPATLCPSPASCLRHAPHLPQQPIPRTMWIAPPPYHVTRRVAWAAVWIARGRWSTPPTCWRPGRR
jgi:hypothetical protein